MAYVTTNSGSFLEQSEVEVGALAATIVAVFLEAEAKFPLSDLECSKVGCHDDSQPLAKEGSLISSCLLKPGKGKSLTAILSNSQQLRLCREKINSKCCLK
jgi:hypothetical protein